MALSPRLCFIVLLLQSAACAARSARKGELAYANATRVTVLAADSGASTICVASAYSRAPLRDVRVVTPATGAVARTGTDGCATLLQQAAQVSVSVGALGYTRRRVPVTVRRGYADTVRVLLRAGASPSEETCRQARRDGQGCL
jgi:hypothetical protein